MKSFISKFKYYILAIVACVFLSTGLFGVTLNTASADNTSESVNTEIYSPNTAMEYYALTAPKDAFLWDDKAAIIMENSKIHVYDGTAYTEISLGDTIVTTQVKKMGDNLVVASLTGLYYINLADYSDKDNLKNSSNVNIGGHYFDFNDDFIVTSGNNTISIYKREGGQIVFDPLNNQNNTIQYDNSRICITKTNDVFYNDRNAQNDIVLYKSNVNNFGTNKEEIVKGQVTAMTVVGDYLYYALNNKFYRVSVNGGEGVELTIQKETNEPENGYELGGLTTPNGVFAKQDGEKVKLIITDSGRAAVQEFEVDVTDPTSPTLSFTGFAIAKNKTAYNRIEKEVSIIEKRGDTILTVAGNILTVIKNGKYEKHALDGAITRACIGDESAVITDGNKIQISPVVEVKDIAFTDAVITGFTNGSKITDIYYQSGKYYAVAFNGDGKMAYVFDEQGKGEIAFNWTKDSENLLISSDVFGNVYISDNGKVSIYNEIEDNYQKTDLTVFNNPTELAVDLEGKLYALCDGKVYRYDGDTTKVFDIKNSAVDKSAKANAFAMDVVNNDVYFTFGGEGFISKTNVLENLAFSNVTSQEIFKPLNYIKEYCVDGAPEKAFVTTDVSLYFLPKITKANTFVIEDGVKVRIKAGSEVLPESKILVEGMEFYLANVTIGEKTYTGYVPVNYTTTELTENAEVKTFTLGKVSVTDVFATNKLDGTPLFTLKENTEIRIFAVKDGVAKIGYKTENGWAEGFITEDAIKQVPNTTIRNILIIVAVAMSVTVSALYFILKKKN